MKNEMFLHGCWIHSAEYDKHQRRVQKALANGDPRPSIPDHIRAKFTVKREDLNGPVQETYDRLVPKEDSNGNVIYRNGRVMFKRAKPVMARTLAPGILAMFKPNVSP